MIKRYMFGGMAAIVIAAAAYAAPDGMGRAKMDANGDGSVSKAEVTANADKRFAKMDADGNGKIDTSDRQAKLKARFAEMDANNNGAVTEAEFMAAAQAKAEFRKSRRSADVADGEGRGGKRANIRGDNVGKWGRADTNNDKAISRDEYDAATLARFSSRDKNGDGALSSDEMKGSKNRWRGQGRRSERSQQPSSNIDAG